MMKHTLTAAALLAILATPVIAQIAKPDANANSPIAVQSSPSAAGANFVSSQQATDWRGSKLIGATVYGSDNASIGEVSDVIIANDGKISAVVIGVGGFLGVGEKNVAIPFDKLNVSRKPNTAMIDKVTVSFSKDELKNAPAFAYYEPIKPATTGSGTTEPPRDTAPIGRQPINAPRQ